MLHKRINFDRFAAVKMYQVYREGNFVEKKFWSVGTKIIFSEWKHCGHFSSAKLSVMSHVISTQMYQPQFVNGDKAILVVVLFHKLNVE